MVSAESTQIVSPSIWSKLDAFLLGYVIANVLRVHNRTPYMTRKASEACCDVEVGGGEMLSQPTKTRLERGETCLVHRPD